MKKTLVVGALASTLVLGAVPVVVPALGMSAFAAETTTGTTVTVAEREALLQEVETKFPDVGQWGYIAGMVDALENQYGCVGMGCAAQEAGILLRNGEKNDTIAAELTAAGIDASKMTDLEKLYAAKGIAKYTSDADFKAVIDAIESEIKSTVFGPDCVANGTCAGESFVGDVANLSKDFDAAAAKGKTVLEVVKQIKQIPGYAEYTALGRAYQQLKYGVNDSENTPEEYRTTPEQIKEYYDTLVSEVAAVEAYEEKQAASTPEKVEVENELQKFVDETKKDETYQKYERLVNAVRYAEWLLKAIKDDSIDLGGKGGDEAPVAVALAEEADYGVEIADAIKAIGDAMRALGIETKLGENLTSANLDDLSAALGQAKTVEKFAEYSALVDAVEAAEVALSNGATDATELKKVLDNIKSAAAKVLPPDTGVAMNSAVDADAAIETTSSLIVLATVAILAGAAVIAKRNLSRKNH